MENMSEKEIDDAVATYRSIMHEERAEMEDAIRGMFSSRYGRMYLEIVKRASSPNYSGGGSKVMPQQVQKHPSNAQRMDDMQKQINALSAMVTAMAANGENANN